MWSTWQTVINKPSTPERRGYLGKWKNKAWKGLRIFLLFSFFFFSWPLLFSFLSFLFLCFPFCTLRGYFFRLIVTKITLLLKSVRVNRYSEEKSVKHQTRVEGLLHTPPNTQTHYTHTTHTHTHKDIIFLNTDPTIWDGSAGQNINSNKCHDTS